MVHVPQSLGAFLNSSNPQTGPIKSVIYLLTYQDLRTTIFRDMINLRTVLPETGGLFVSFQKKTPA